MKTIELTNEQRRKVVDALVDVRDEETFEIEIEVGDTLTVEASGRIETEGYREDDYFNGTGAWVETYRSASVELTAYDDDGDEYRVDTITERAAEKCLNELSR